MPASFRRYALALLVMLACLGLPGLALAHAALNGSMPADGSVSSNAPDRVALIFSEPVSPLALRLIRPDRTTTALDRFVLKDNTVVITPPTGLTNGTYALSWRVVSEDGHPVGGTLVFSIGAPGSAAPETGEQTDPNVRLLLWFGRFGLYLGLFLGCGAAASRAWVGPLTTGAGRLAAAMTIFGLVCLPVALGAQGLDAMGASAAAVFRPAIWKAAAATSYVWTIVGAAIALLLAVAGLGLRRTAAASPLGLLSAAAAGIALASSGHASTAHPQWLMRPTVFLHASTIALWVGALFPLATALRTDAGGVALRRFSFGITIIVAVLLLSGAVLAFVQVGTPAALLSTDYGRVLLAKLALVGIAFLLAAINRWRLTARAEARDPTAARVMTRVIGVEIAVLVLVLGTAALWRFTPPPRAIAAAQSQPASVHIHTSQAMADIIVSPGRAGPVSVEVVLMNGEFGSMPAKELGLSFSNPAAGIEPIERQARLGPDGIWRVDPLSLPVPGRWEVELAILISDFEMRRLRDAVVIRP